MPGGFQRSNCTCRRKSSIYSSRIIASPVSAQKRREANWKCARTSSLARTGDIRLFKRAPVLSDASLASQSTSSGCEFPRSRMTRNNHLAFSSMASCSCCWIVAITGSVDLSFPKAASTRSKRAVCRSFKAISSTLLDFWGIEWPNWMTGQRSNC